MKTYKTLERKSRVLGISLSEMGLLLAATLSLFVLAALAQFFIAISGWVYVGFMALIMALYGLLRKMGKHKQSGYLLSFISFHFYQPKEIWTYEFEKK